MSCLPPSLTFVCVCLCVDLQAANQKEKYHKICLKKQNIPVRELCKGLPAEFGTLLSYCRNLKFDEAPNYNYCRKLLREVFEQNGYTLDYVYDWTMKQNEGSTNRSAAATETETNASNRPQPNDSIQEGTTGAPSPTYHPWLDLVVNPFGRPPLSVPPLILLQLDEPDATLFAGRSDGKMGTKAGLEAGSAGARVAKQSGAEQAVEGGAKGKGKQLVPSSDGKGDSMQCKTQ
jgi:hypothetical protein